MKFNTISIVTDKNSWLNNYIGEFIASLKLSCANVYLLHDLTKLIRSDIVFYLSFSKIVAKEYLALSKYNLVVHGSALPQGKGWSPLTWQIIEGKNEIPMTLFEAADDVDSGKIYLQETMKYEGHELIDELRPIQALCTFNLGLRFIENYDSVIKNAREQTGEKTYYKKRSAQSSKLDVNATLAESFNQLRVVDNEKYPAFFEYRGHTYRLKIEKI